jgi:hypothetical protein
VKGLWKKDNRRKYQMTVYHLTGGDKRSIVRILTEVTTNADCDLHWPALSPTDKVARSDAAS